MEKPSRCYIRQEWFEAVSFLPPEDRCAFYEALMSFVYYGTQRDTLPPSVRGMLEICKPTLLKDIQSYSQKVVANRQNGSAGGRPRGDITQNNPTQPTKTEKVYNIHIQKQLQNTISYPEIDEEQRQRLILIELFMLGVANPLQEAQKMCDYYGARGWVDKGGNPIVDVCKQARVWKVDNKSSYFANVRKKWGIFCKSIGSDLDNVLITDFSRMAREKEDGKTMAVIYCTSKNFVATLEEKHLNALKMAVKSWAVDGIIYKIETPENAKKEVLEPFIAV